MLQKRHFMTGGFLCGELTVLVFFVFHSGPGEGERERDRE